MNIIEKSSKESLRFQLMQSSCLIAKYSLRVKSMQNLRVNL